MNDIDIDNMDKVKFKRHSKTSRAAAESVVASVGTMQWQLLTYLREFGEGATDEELWTALEFNPNSERPCRVLLVEAGLVRDSGFTRPTKSGRSAVVWIATPVFRPGGE